MMHRPGVGHDVDQFVGIEAAGRRGGDVADVVRAGAERGEAEVGEGHQHVGRVFRHDLADLDIGAGGQVDVAGTPALRHPGEAAELLAGERTAGDAAAEHQAFLGGRDEEQAVELVAEDVAIPGELLLRGVGEDGVVAIEAVLLVLDEFFPAKLVERGAVDALFGLMGEAAFGVLAEEGQFPALKDAGDEAGEVGGLFGTEAGVAESDHGLYRPIEQRTC